MSFNGFPESTSLIPLASTANATIVRLNYRLSTERKYPTPIHDVLAGYDWVARNLVRGSLQGMGRAGPGKVAVCGELIGGSLAAALTFTECHSMKTGIRAAVMGSPISDWTAMYPIKPRPRSMSAVATTTSTKKRATRLSAWEANASSEILSAAALLKARRDLFRLPEDYFDPFASPTLFFRTPSSSIPGVIDPLDELFFDLDISPEQSMKKRRSYRRFPPPALSLQLPDALFWVGEESVLRDQGIDLAEGMARSNHLYGGPSGTGEGTGWERVEVELKHGTGCWGEAELVDIGTWFGQKLRD